MNRASRRRAGKAKADNLTAKLQAYLAALAAAGDVNAAAIEQEIATAAATVANSATSELK